MPGLIALAAFGVITIFSGLQLLLRYVHDEREPPIAPTAVPFFGHMIGMSRKKTKYYIELRYVNRTITHSTLPFPAGTNTTYPFILSIYQGRGYTSSILSH